MPRVKVGGPHALCIAGPCAVENEQMLNRIARNPGGEGLEFAPLQALIKEIFQDIEQNPGARDPVKAQFLKVRVPLIFFVDSMIAESKLGIRGIPIGSPAAA